MWLWNTRKETVVYKVETLKEMNADEALKEMNAEETLKKINTEEALKEMIKKMNTEESLKEMIKNMNAAEEALKKMNAKKKTLWRKMLEPGKYPEGSTIWQHSSKKFSLVQGGLGLILRLEDPQL
ncbi:UNVERIFIED_CONTAM: hypothetical protein Sangu_1504100 [Sesamum angustifolium]|uniref:Uncharacterized protein n=1 Tax=Sesamum angustifolium TaxID=2727405 RepID=A0AAW2MPM6_9LAMI